jgi:Protein of unknown function (DUF2786)
MTIEMTDEKMAARIALLLRKAESTTPQEAEALRDHAYRLMTRHAIDSMTVRAKAAGADVTPEEIVKSTMTFASWLGPTFVDIVHRIACAWGDVQVIRERVSGTKTLCYLVGYESDVRAVETLATSIVLQARAELDTWWSELKDTGRTRGMSSHATGMLRRDYLLGFGVGAGEKLRSVREKVVDEAERATPGTAVALIDRAEAVSRYVQDTWKLRQGRGPSVRPNSYAAGAEAGRQANVGGTELNGRRSIAAS